MSVVSEKVINCEHCGDGCVDNLIYRDEKPFCCEGCSLVYQILEENDLSQVYHEDFQVKKRKQTSFDYLEHDEIQQKLILFRNETHAKVVLNLPSIHCSACIIILENLPSFLRGITRANVNFGKKELTILYKHEEVALKEIASFLNDLGYTPDFSLAALDGKKKKKYNNLGIKIAVAGFCFGNSMLISLPDYLDSNLHLEEKYKLLFGTVNILLILPIVFYASRDYFKSAIKGLQKKQINLDVPIALGIVVLFGRTIFEIISGTGAGYADSLTGLVFFLLLGKWYQNRTYQALAFDRDYKSFFPISVTKINDGKEISEPLSSVQVDDHLLIRNNELIPVDGILAEGKGAIDYSFVTGESKPESVTKKAQVFAGGKHLGAPIIIQASKTVDSSYLTQLWKEREEKHEDDPALTMTVNKISKHFTLAIILISLGTGVYWYFIDYSLLWTSVSSVLIVACPCALALASPFAYGHAMRLLGRSGIYVKEAAVIERLARVKEIIWDKTGTLTNPYKSDITFKGTNLTYLQQRLIKTAVHNSMHPLSKIIFNSLNKDLPLIEIASYEEHTGKGIELQADGHALKIGSAEFVGAKPEDQEINESRVYISINNNVLGYYSFLQNYRKGILNMLISLGKNYKLHLLSGDNDAEHTKLSPYFENLSFNQSPFNKKDYIKNLSGVEIAMIGDGLNDAGALRLANVGIAVTDDIHQFSPACDIIYDAKKLGGINNYLAFAKKTVSIVYAAFIISFLYNIVGLSLAVSGNLTPLISAILMPVSSVTIVLFVSLGVEYIFKNVSSNKAPLMIKVIDPAVEYHTTAVARVS